VNVPMADLPAQYAGLKPEIDAAVLAIPVVKRSDETQAAKFRRTAL